MMKLRFTIGNDAFKEDYTGENIRILESIINKIQQGQKNGKVIDLNGNTVGEWKI